MQQRADKAAYVGIDAGFSHLPDNNSVALLLKLSALLPWTLRLSWDKKSPKWGWSSGLWVQPSIPSSITPTFTTKWAKNRDGFPLLCKVLCQVWIDNFVFRLHSRITVMILFASCIIVSLGQFFGDPIDCLVDVSICLQTKQSPHYFEHFSCRKKFQVV